MNMNIRKTLKHSALYLALLAIIGGCDVTDDEIDGEGGSTQDGDAVVVDFPIAYIQRPVPIGLADEDDVQVSILTENVLEPSESRAGAVLIMKDRAAVSAATRIITEGVFPSVMDANGDPQEPLYDVRDLNVNAEGTKLVFSMRAPLDENLDDDDPDQPTWNIWEYDTEDDTLTRAILSDTNAEKGHDRFPSYLPDDSIVFSSTRQRNSKRLLLDLNGSGFTYVTEADDESRAFTLHRIDSERESISQISYGKGHDIYPTVLDDGRILFLRGDDTSNANRDRLSFYTMHPDGTNLSIHYGFHSPSGSDQDGMGALIQPRQVPDSDDILVTYKPRETTIFGGDIYIVDTENYIDNTQPTAANIGATGPAEESISVGEVVLEAQSPHGYFNSAYPMDDGTGRLLVSWMPCLVQGYRLNIYVERIDTDITDEDDVVIGVNSTYQLINVDGELVDEDGDLLAEGADPVIIPFADITSLPCTSDTFENENILPSEPQFGVWVYDPATETQDPVVLANDVGTIYTEAVVLAPLQDTPTFIPDATNTDVGFMERLTTNNIAEFTGALMDEQVGVINIKSIYDIDGVDASGPGITAMANPLITPADSRAIRFVRFLSEANLPHEDELEIDEDLIEGRGNSPSRSIIGYSQVHPDGSVMAKLPADTAFTMEFVDANGRRVNSNVSRPHRNWINVRPGEVRTCNGCHAAGSTAPHGRPDAEPEPANEGALAEVAFANTSLNDRFGTPYPAPQISETMAEYYVRTKLQDSEEPDPLKLSLDLKYEDEWSDAAVTGIQVGTPIDIAFGDPEALGPNNLLTVAPVFLSSCLIDWEYRCRTVIDYPDHIQPIFEVPRTTTDSDGADIDITCLSCHAPLDADGLAQVPAPDADGFQLDFTPIISPLDDDMVFLKGYDELFEDGDLQVELNEDGLLVVRQIPQVINGEIQYQTTAIRDIDGNATFEYLDLAGDTVCAADGSTDPDLTQVLDANDAIVPCIRFVCTVDDAGDEVFNDVNANGNFDREDSCVERQPILVPDEQPQYLTPNGANAARNQRFFDAFASGGAHEGYLTPAEIKLFSEWLDVGGQYYNDIFKAIDD
ncbi:MAG: hypothetical protein K6L81_07805 [Agarilytica sp.]